MVLFLTDWGFLLGLNEALIFSMLAAFVTMLAHCCADVQKYVRVWIGLKLILGLAIIVASILVGYYILRF